MNTGQDQAAKVRKLVDEISQEVNHIDNRNPNIYANCKFKGVLCFLTSALYAEVQPGSFYESYTIEALENFLEEIKQEEIMEKLRS